MSRVESLTHFPAQARAALRSRLAALPSRPPASNWVPPDRVFPRDTDILRLLLDTDAISNDEVASARGEYARLCSKEDSGLPEFDEALARGWFRTIDGRVSAAAPAMGHYLRDDVPCADELRGFAGWLHEIQYRVARPGTYGTAQAFEDYLGAGAIGEHPVVQTPSWVAARLWEQSVEADLRTWGQRWELLGWATFTPSAVWAAPAAQRFTQAALLALRDSGLPQWDHASMSQILRTSADVREVRPATLKSDLLGRALDRQSTMYRADLFDVNTLCALMRVLALEMLHTEVGPAPSDLAQQLVTLATRHPDLCMTLMDCCRQHPSMLADLLMCPDAASLVCYMAATWHAQFQLSREHYHEATNAVQSALLKDCLDVLRVHLLQGSVAPVACARLLIEMQLHDCDEGNGLTLLSLGLEHLHQLPGNLQRQVRTELVQMTDSKVASPEFALMLKVAAVVDEPFPQGEADAMAEAYRQAFNGPQRPDTRWLDTAGAAVLARVAMQYEDLRASIFKPIDLDAAFRLQPDDSVLLALGLSMREQIRMLSRAVTGWASAVPDALVDALVKTIESSARERKGRATVDAFSFHHEMPFSRWRGPRLESDLIDALERLQIPAQQEKLVQALLLVEEPVVLAMLARHAPKAHQKVVRTRLESMTPGMASVPNFITQSAERAQAFLDLNMPEAAAPYLQESDEVLRVAKRPELAVHALNQRLQFLYLSERYAEIAAADMPADLRPEQRQEAHRTLDFYKAIACLRATPSMAGNAVATLRRLYQQAPISSYAINLFAAQIVEILGGDLFRSLSGEEADTARRALEETDRAIPSARELSSLSRSIHIPNCATVLLALGQHKLALQRLSELTPNEVSLQSTAFEAIALARQGAGDRAHALLRSSEERHGSDSLLVAARGYIEHTGGFEAAPLVLSKQEWEVQLRSAMRLFLELSPAEQARVLRGTPLALEEVLTSAFQDAIAAFERTLSFLKLHEKNLHEDDFNGILAALLEARLEGIFGWQAHEQSPGGFTRNGNAGRRDFVLRRNSVDIAVVEALKSDRPNDERIAEHLHKLFGYSTTNFFFYVIYSSRRDVAEMRAAARAVAAQPPAGTTYLRSCDIPADGARPGALRAAYLRNGTPVTVIFFAIDMLQQGLREAVGGPLLPST